MSLAAVEPVQGRLTSPGQAALAFRRLRGRLLRNHVQALLSASRLRLATIACCSVIFWAGLFGLFFEGFQFLDFYIKVSNEIVEYLFSIFFLSLMVMLIVSTGIILYAGLFQSRESTYLLTTPAPTDQVFAHKFLEALAFSSWGFVLLGSPILVAFGITSEKAGWPFYATFLAFLIAFVVLCGGLGAIAAILLATLLPRSRKAVLLVGSGSLLVAVVVVVVRLWRTPGETLSSEWLNAMINRLTFSSHPLLPSRWMAAGLTHFARGEWGDGLFYLMVLSAHAGLAYLVAAVVARDLYRLAYNRVQGGRSSRRRVGRYAFDALFHRAFGVLPRPIRLLILKDLRTFLRDPTQWSQFLIFFGLLAFYFLSIPRLGYHVQSDYFRNLLSFLNLAVTALILSTFTSRFIFPMLSLEGRNFWVLGLLPLKRESILWGKFAFSAGISLVATEVLVVLSDLMLKMGGAMIALHMGMVAILCLGLSGISVGLGARLPNLRESDPSKIAAGFGGTLNLLVSLVFILVVIGSIALPCHLYFAGRTSNTPVLTSLTLGQFRSWLTWAILLSLVVGALATILPLRIGIKAFREMEF